MAIRLPLTTVVSLTNDNEVGAGSVNGVVASAPFQIPIDTDNVLVKLTATVAGGGVSAMLQTTDDGGSTWFGAGRTSIVSAATGDNVEWMSIPVAGFGVPTASIVAVGSVISSGGVGSAKPSVLSSKSMTGLPLLSATARIALQLQAGVTSSSILTQVKANSQAPHA